MQASSDFSAFGFQRFRIFGTHTKGLDFSMFGFQTVYEILTFEHVPLASKWLATGFFGFVDTPMFRFTEYGEGNKLSDVCR